MKIQWKNLIFILFVFSKICYKNRAFGNNTIFLQQFFRFFGGGENLPLPPLATPLRKLNIFYKNLSVFSKNYLKIWLFLEVPYKSREIPDEFYYLVETFFKKGQKMALM